MHKIYLCKYIWIVCLIPHPSVCLLLLFPSPTPPLLPSPPLPLVSEAADSHKPKQVRDKGSGDKGKGEEEGRMASRTQKPASSRRMTCLVIHHASPCPGSACHVNALFGMSCFLSSPFPFVLSHVLSFRAWVYAYRCCNIQAWLCPILRPCANLGRAHFMS